MAQRAAGGVRLSIPLCDAPAAMIDALCAGSERPLVDGGRTPPVSIGPEMQRVALRYDFAPSTRGVRLHAVRVATFDGAVRSFLGVHPAGTVVALGEGLETQFWRLDNGRVRSLTVDLPETMELRGRLLLDGPRQSSHSGLALDLGWVDGLSPADPILVTAQGLFPYSSAIRSTA
jgi:O-methyltransferase involved in polyketide biosynthesis